MSATIKGVGIHNIHGTFIEAREPRTACEVSYEPETVYEASVRNSTIWFMFSYREGVKRVSVMNAKRSTYWCSYHIGTATEVYYYVPKGTWILRIHVGCVPDWLFKDKKDGALSTAIVSKAWGKHYDTVIMDDMSAYTTKKDVEKEVKQVTKWYEKVKKEEKGRVVKYLYSVRIFNIKTEVTEYQAELVGKDTREVEMLAAQAFGKFDPKIHIVDVESILNFSNKDVPEE